jgi:DNA-directed RNA polymerase specialized sigma24 family protein
MDMQRSAASSPESANSAQRFPRTRWTLVLQAQDKSNATDAHTALNTLCETYWYPLYAFARSKGYSEHDAKDFTQGFFLYLLEHDLFSQADRDKGKLRTFLVTVFQRYLIRDYRRNEAEKRGGGLSIDSLDEKFEEGEGRYRLEPFVNQDPAEVFLKAWAVSVLDLSRRLLHKEMGAEGKSETFQALEPFLEPDRERTHSYEAVARQLGVRQDALRQVVSRFRKRYGELIRAQIADTLEDPSKEAIDEEMRVLRGAMGW